MVHLGNKSTPIWYILATMVHQSGTPWQQNYTSSLVHVGNNGALVVQLTQGDPRDIPQYTTPPSAPANRQPAHLVWKPPLKKDHEYPVKRGGLYFPDHSLIVNTLRRTCNLFIWTSPVSDVLPCLRKQTGDTWFGRRWTSTNPSVTLLYIMKHHLRIIWQSRWHGSPE